MGTLGISLNLNGARPSQYLGFDFKSLAMFNGTAIAAGDDGIFELSGDTDNGVAIEAYALFPSLDFNSPYQKIPHALRIRYESAGQLTLSLIPDEDDQRERSIPLVPLREGQVSQSQLKGVPRMRDDSACYWAVKISNEDGVDFSINSLDLILTFLMMHNGT